LHLLYMGVLYWYIVRIDTDEDIASGQSEYREQSAGSEQRRPGILVERVYEERGERFRAEFERETGVWNRTANLRLLAFVLAVSALGWGLLRSLLAFELAGLLVSGVFVGLVVYHRIVTRRRRRFEGLWKINVEAGLRVKRAWDLLPVRHTVRAEPGEPYAADLDIFGHASLFHLLDTVTTHAGEVTLASWLRKPSAPESVRERQGVVAELAPMVDLRDELELRGRLTSEERPDPERFLAWAESDRWLARRAWMQPAASVSVVALWALLLAQLTGITPYPAWMLFAAPNLLFTLTVGRRIQDLLTQAGAGEAGFRHYASAFELIRGTDFQSPGLKGLQATLGPGAEGGADAAGCARRLYRLTGLVIPASASLYLVLQVLTLWNVHLLAALERWKQKAGTRARAWLEALGEFEALSALGRLAHDNPGWAFPRIDQDAEALEARGLGHPLIRADRRVDNDVDVGPPGTFLLVTGSNMSGKSTLLRAIGVNIVLAEAGAPVCAAALRLPPVDLWTSMRVEDSLEHGVSYYMAELQRLKSVVDAARADSRAGERKLFYLLDEILQGTNTAERQIAARRVIMYLVRQGAIGAVSTHDLTLAEAPDVASAARLVHFTETLSNGRDGRDGTGDPSMTFDYKLRPGIATSTNALRLMEIVGLDLGEN
jgi:hypothetical protein